MIPEKIARFLVIGLGNPGTAYSLNRHNVGWLFLDRLADAMLKGAAFAPCAGMAAEAVDGRWAGRRLILLKPQTYMNLSGQAVAKAVHHYGVDPAGILVVYDEVELPFGTIRIREKGSAGGHNGMDSVMERLGTQAVKRIRIGIGPEAETPEERRRRNLADYVLGDFNEDECASLAKILDVCVAATKEILRGTIGRAMSRFNGPVFEDAPEAQKQEKEADQRPSG